MKKSIIFKLILSIILVFSLSSLIGCDLIELNNQETKEKTIVETKEKTVLDPQEENEKIIENAFSMLASMISLETSEDLFLLDEYQGVSFTYTSDNPEVLGSDGKVNLPESDTFASLSISCSYGDTVIEKSFTIIIRAKSLEDDQNELNASINAARDLLLNSYNLIDESLYTDNEMNALHTLIEEKNALLIKAVDINEVNSIIDDFYKDFNELFFDLSKYIESAKKEIREYYYRYDQSELNDSQKNECIKLLNSYLNDVETQTSIETILDTVYLFENNFDQLTSSFKGSNIDITLNSYYDSINLSLTGNGLKLALRTLITNTHKHKTSYDDIKTLTIQSDGDPKNKNNIILIYTRRSVRGTWDGGNTWNREHVWPRSKSWFQYSEAGSDLHHLRPEDPGENSSRGNKPFGSQTNGSQYYPGDEGKGDVARIIFYLLVRYSESDSYKITNVAISMDLLLKWNEEDPVDDLEIKRNEVVYGVQGNRNPFIDCPELANLIWGKVNVSFDVNGDISVIIQINYCILSDLEKDYYSI